MSNQSVSGVDVIVTIDEKHSNQLQVIAAQLAAEGFKVNETLGNVGAITGKAQPDSLDRLRGISGVIAVELSGDVKIPPPDSDIQ